MNLGEFISNYRAEHSISQRQFAKMCGASHGYISIIENGMINPKNKKPLTVSIFLMKRMATAMGMSLQDLIDSIDGDMCVNIADNEIEAIDEMNGKKLSDNDELRELLYLFAEMSPEHRASLKELARVIPELSSDNLARLLDLTHLFLSAQGKTSGTE